MEHIRDFFSRVFRDIVTTAVPKMVTFSINGVDIPIQFILKNRVLMLPDLPSSPRTGPYGEIPRCIEVMFIDHAVDLAHYYLYLGRPRQEICPEISHELFFILLDIVAKLYQTKITLADQSTAIINGFMVPSIIVSVSKKNGRTFYGKYGFESAGLDPAFEAVSNTQIKDVPEIEQLGIETEEGDTLQNIAQKMIVMIESCGENEEERKRMRSQIEQWRMFLDLELRKHLDYDKGIQYSKEPENYNVHLEHSDTKEGPYTRFASNDPNSMKPFMKICAEDPRVGTKRAYTAGQRRIRKTLKFKNRVANGGSQPKQGCLAQTAHKYVARDSPAYPANQCCGKVMLGKTGAMYKSTPTRKGICRWMKSGKQGKSPPKKNKGN